MLSSTRLPKAAASRSLLSGRSSISSASRALSTQSRKPTPNQSRINGPQRPQNLRDPKGFNYVFHQAAKSKDRKDGRPLTFHRYHGLMDALAANELSEEAMALLEDMYACGAAPDIRVYNFALKACLNQPRLFRELLKRMEKEGVPWDGITYSRLIHHRLRDGELELALQDFHSMLKNGFSIGGDVIERLVVAAARGDHPRLALDLIRVYEAGSQKDVAIAGWVETLTKSVELYYDDGIRTCLERVKKAGISIDEGLTTDLLLYSARVADLELAESMLKHLEELGVKPQEQHLSPLLEIHVKKDNLDGVFAVLERMTDAGINPSARSAQCLADGLRDRGSQATLRKVYDALELYKQSGKATPIALINAVLGGTIWCADKVNWWTKLYDDLPSYNTSPNIRTFNTLLMLCSITKDEPLSQRIYDDIMSRSAEAATSSSAGKNDIKPTAVTYKYLSLIAVQQQTYEAAFHWLEETKAAGFVPVPEFYVNLVRRCGWRNDVRWKPALEEMKAQGYNTSGVEKFLKSRGIVLDGKGEVKGSEGTREAAAKMNRSGHRGSRKVLRDAKSIDGLV